MCFWFILKQLGRPHPELVDWWLLVHSSPLYVSVGQLGVVGWLSVWFQGSDHGFSLSGFGT
jgi:hypothetical protein